MDYHKDCIFCKIANKEVDSYKIYEDDRVFVFLVVVLISMVICLLFLKNML